jgi:hypothetical protein
VPRHAALFLALVIQSAACSSAAGCLDEATCDVRTVEVTVHDDRVLRTETLDGFFSFNMNHYRFEKDLVGPDGVVDPSVITNLQAFPAAYYRYPGGLVANGFSWEAATGDPARRGLQATSKHTPSTTVRFGVDEYLGFVRQVGGRPWYVLNLQGWDPKKYKSELPGAVVAESNARLVRHMLDQVDVPIPQYFQLGNELDRADYQWPVAKYVERSRASIDAIRRELPDARFVAFLRDFDWTYKGKNDPRAGTQSLFKEFIPAVLDGLPDVDDFSLHFYYDDPGQSSRAKRVGSRLKSIEAAIASARAARDGKAPNVWITEHARGINLKTGKGMQRAAVTSNLSAAVSTADFLIALTQIPEVKGAFWHGLNAGPWQLFDATIEYRDLRPRPVYWGYRVLHSVMLPETLETETGPQAGAQYVDGYDVRAAAFRSTDGQRLGLWVANRRDQKLRLSIRYQPFRSEQVAVSKYEIYAPAGSTAGDADPTPTVELDPDVVTATFGSDGRLEIIVEPSSVTAVNITR